MPLKKSSSSRDHSPNQTHTQNRTSDKSCIILFHLCPFQFDFLLSPTFDNPRPIIFFRYYNRIFVPFPYPTPLPPRNTRKKELNYIPPVVPSALHLSTLSPSQPSFIPPFPKIKIRFPHHSQSPPPLTHTGHTHNPPPPPPPPPSTLHLPRYGFVEKNVLISRVRVVMDSIAMHSLEITHGKTSRIIAKDAHREEKKGGEGGGGGGGLEWWKEGGLGGGLG